MSKAILFDLDGTLIDSESYYVKQTYEFVLKYNDKISIEDIYPIIGLTMEDTYTYVSVLCHKDITTEYDKHFMDNPFSFKEVIFPDVRDCLKKLKDNKFIIGICSMSPYGYVKQFVEECDLKDYVDYYIGGDKCKHNKPDPEIYLCALDVLKLNKNDVIVVEDAYSGIEAGKSAGLKVIARDASRFGINQGSADIIIKDLNELIEIINYE